LSLSPPGIYNPPTENFKFLSPLRGFIILEVFMALHKPEHRTVSYWLMYVPRALLYLTLLPVAIYKGRHEEMATSGLRMKWNWYWFRQLEDKIDDPIDWLKHKLFNIGTLP
jgi:hypothetical protein